MTTIEHAPIINKEYTERLTCRSCDTPNMTDILSLGNQSIVGFDNKDHQPKIPLTLCLCESCKLVQLRHTTNPSLLYTENYGYRSGINEMMVTELKDVTNNIEQVVSFNEGDVVVDIGANDGTLLASYEAKGIKRIGFDPSRNMIPHFRHTMEAKGINDALLVASYFDKWPFIRNSPDKKAKVVTAISMFYDLEDPNEFLQGINEVLDQNGVFVVQQNYVAGMISQLAFDNICHEHLEYYSLTSMTTLLERNGLEIFDVEERDINGGSFRTYIRHIGSTIDREGGIERMNAMLMKESQMGLRGKEVYERFGKKVEENGSKLKGYIQEAVADGKKVYVYGASTRGNTLLQSYGLDSNLISGAAERNTEKHGKLYGDTGIHIVSEEEARKEADVFLCLPWFLKDSFIKREQEFVNRGGILVFPLPTLQVYGKS